MMKSYKTLLLALLLLVPLGIVAQSPETDRLRTALAQEKKDSARIEIMIQLAVEYNQTIPDSSIYFSLEATNLSRLLKNDLMLAKALNYLGASYIRGAEYSNALNALTEARAIIDKYSDERSLKAQILRGIGNIYFIQYKQEEAMAFYQDALEIFEELNDSAGMGNIYNNFANIYYETSQNDSTRLDSAVVYYKKALEINLAKDDVMGAGSIYLNMGMLYETMDSTELAIEYSEKAIEIAEEYNAMVMMTYPLKVLSTIYRKERSYDKAIEYAQRSLDIAEAMGINYEEKDAHLNLASAYEELGQFDKAYFHYTAYDNLNDSLLNENANSRLAEMKASYETEKKEQEIKVLEAENNMHKARIAAISSGIALLFITTVIALLWFVSRKRKEVQLLEKDKIIAESKKILAEEELENSRIREETLQKELTNYALHIVEKNDFLEEVKSEMAEIRVDIENSEAIRHINKLGSKIYQNLMINKDRREFELQVEQTCSGFFRNLDSKFPELTPQERRLAALLRLNLSSKEISGIMNISPKSVDQGRYRLRKKLNIDKDLNLSGFLNQV